MNKKRAFTLAEVLITLAIVGVVAAVTLPTLNTNVQKQGLSSQIAKFDNQFAKAIDMYKSENELDSLPAGFSPTTFIERYFKVAQKCSTVGANDTQASTCYAPEYKSISSSTVVAGKTFEPAGSEQVDADKDKNVGGKVKAPDYVDAAYMLTDGAVVTVRVKNKNKKDGEIAEVIFDVNGTKGPNIIGYDLQQTTLYSEGRMDRFSSKDIFSSTSESINTTLAQELTNCQNGSNVSGCYGYLKRNGFRFDY